MESNSQSNYLVIFNPISNEGHLDSWHVMFINMMVRSGWKVIAATEDPDELKKKLIVRGLSDLDRVVVVGLSPQSDSLLSKIRQLWKRWNAFCDVRLSQQQSDKWLDQITNRSIKYLKVITQKLHVAYATTRRQARKTQVHQSTAHIDPSDFKEKIHQILLQYPVQIYAVLNMYVDAYKPDKSYWENFSLPRDIPWMGLCITPSTEPKEGYYELPSYRGTCFLDEFVYERYQRLMPHKRFEFLPDITETTLPEYPGKIASEIKNRARDRKIVFMGGSIGKQKNLASWYKLLAMLDAERWYFVQIGRINTNNLTPDDEIALNSILLDCPSNLYIYPDYLKDERSFNEIISISDVVFAVYRDFFRSSNMLSKAAYFEKPILVTEGCLMGDRVNHYGIGKAVSQENVQNMHEGLLALEHISDLKNNFQKYRQDFNEAIVQLKLSRFVIDCIKE